MKWYRMILIYADPILYICWLVCVCVYSSQYHTTYVAYAHGTKWACNIKLSFYAITLEIGIREKHTHTHIQTTIYYDYYCYYDIVIMHSLTDSVLLAFSFFALAITFSPSLPPVAVYLSKICAHFSPHTLCVYGKWVLKVYAPNSNIHAYYNIHKSAITHFGTSLLLSQNSTQLFTRAHTHAYVMLAFVIVVVVIATVFTIP